MDHRRRTTRQVQCDRVRLSWLLTFYTHQVGLVDPHTSIYRFIPLLATEGWLEQCQRVSGCIPHLPSSWYAHGVDQATHCV